MSPASSARARSFDDTIQARQRSSDWLHGMLARNRDCGYLRAFGAPNSLDEFRNCVPLCRYEDLAPSIARLQAGAADVLFAGRPVAYERTGGSSSGPKLIPYSREGLLDFQNNVAPWLAGMLARYDIRGRVYFSISPATRAPELAGDIPIGLPDEAYLGTHLGRVLLEQSAVPPEVGLMTDVAAWRSATLQHLAAARDLELISVWSPTFLLRLLDDLSDPARLWPRLKVVSCWASGPARKFADELQRRIPHAVVQPKGLLSTEAVITVPDAASRPELVENGFCEFAADGELFLEDQLCEGGAYEVVATTASGLYRYRTGDFVRYEGSNACHRPILEFIGRHSLTCDIAGEKLTEGFVSNCLQSIAGHAFLVPCFERPGYALVCADEAQAARVEDVERHLAANPQYAYARHMGQLAPLSAVLQPRARTIVEQYLLGRGVRLGDVKPLALRSEAFWLPLLAEDLP